MREPKNLTIKKVSHLELNKPSKHEIERLCRNDEKCLAYGYSEHFGHGSLCGSTTTTEYDRYVICSKGEINLMLS